MDVISKFLLASVVVLLVGHGAAAEGAIAIGIDPGGTQVAVSFGLASNQTTSDVARAKALETCRVKAEKFPKAQSRCAVVASFRNKCVAVAWDPADNKPGFGWALELEKTNAENRALAQCRDTAGQERESFCAVALWQCDGAKSQ
jgi:hypothetical protein